MDFAGQWRPFKSPVLYMPRNLVLRRSPIHGNGVFAARDLPTGTRLIEYRGTLRSHDEVDDCYGGDYDSGHTFLFTLNEQYVVDANVNGNIARWINTSCDPNCEAAIVEDSRGRRDKDRIFIETIKPVRAGEELTYDYGITLDEAHTPKLKKIWACRCGKTNCTGTMLRPKRPRKK
jgi:SET domain-containing protein